MPRLYMIGVRWSDPVLGLPRTDSVDLAVSGLGEWLRYNGDTWLVLCEAEAKEISSRVRPALNTADNIIVLPVDPIANVGGWAPKSVWDFVFKRSSWSLNALAGGSSGFGGLSALGGDTGEPSLGRFIPPFAPSDDKK